MQFIFWDSLLLYFLNMLRWMQQLDGQDNLFSVLSIDQAVIATQLHMPTTIKKHYGDPEVRSLSVPY